ncbi:MAG: hypothetical protein FWG50_14020 [Kiritimatiellaeota bacterium]|nr:hypothetical protein [Kiritimatiellota bacterium]
MRATSQYQLRFKRRPVLFWWQTFALFGIVGLLFSEVPVASICRQARTHVAPLPPPSAAYVTLDPDTAAQLFKRSLVTWMTFQSERSNRPGLDLSALDFDNTLGAPDFLEQSDVFANNRPPLVIAALPVALAEIQIPSAGLAADAPSPRTPQGGLFITPSAALTAAGFTFPSEGLNVLKERSGECRFYVETDAEGYVVHVLLRSKHSPETAQVERALMRGRANGAASGMVDIRWSFAK